MRVKLAKYEKKMANYRKNIQRRNKKRALYEAQFETVEVEVKLPYEIRKTKPNASKGVKTDCVFKWSPIALEMKKALHDYEEVNKEMLDFLIENSDRGE